MYRHVSSRRAVLKSVFLVGALVLSWLPVLGQRNTSNALLDQQAASLALKFPDRTNLRRTFAFARAENWDSVLVHSSRVLSERPDPELRDFLHYYRMEAFRSKGIFEQALKESRIVRRSFPFYFKLELIRGEIYLEQGKFQQALGAFLRIDTTDRQQMVNIRLDAVQHNTGLCYFHLGNYQLAENYLLRAVSKLTAQNDYPALIASYMDLGNIYYEQYLDDKAIFYFKQAYELSKTDGTVPLKQNAALNMAVVEENREHFREANSYRKEYEAWHDSLNDQNKIYEVAQLEKKFAVDRQQKQVRLLETENRLKQTERNLYLFAAVLLLVIILFGIYFYRQNLKRSKIILLQKEELDLLNATKDQLFSILSHDLRSSVHALRSGSAELKNTLARGDYARLDEELEHNSTIATNTYNMLDNLLQWVLLQTTGGYFRQEEHRLSMLTDQVAYNFQGMLRQRGITFENKLPGSLKAFVDAESLKLVLRNFMDNSIKFAQETGVITIALEAETDTTICFAWEDTGKGMSEATRLRILSNSPHLSRKAHEQTIGSGLGMQLCKSMLKKNGGSLDIRSNEPQGVKMIVTLQKKGTHGAD